MECTLPSFFFSGMTFFVDLIAGCLFFFPLFINSVLSVHFFDVRHLGTLGLACLSNEPHHPLLFFTLPQASFYILAALFFFFESVIVTCKVC